MYTIQSLWTMAREQLDVTVVIFNNRSYAILNMELARVGAQAAGPRAKAQLDLGDAGHRFRQARDRPGGAGEPRATPARRSPMRSPERSPSRAPT